MLTLYQRCYTKNGTFCRCFKKHYKNSSLSGKTYSILHISHPKTFKAYEYEVSKLVKIKNCKILKPFIPLIRSVITKVQHLPYWQVLLFLGYSFGNKNKIFFPATHISFVFHNWCVFVYYNN